MKRLEQHLRFASFGGWDDDVISILVDDRLVECISLVVPIKCFHCHKLIQNIAHQCPFILGHNVNERDRTRKYMRVVEENIVRNLHNIVFNRVPKRFSDDVIGLDLVKSVVSGTYIYNNPRHVRLSISYPINDEEIPLQFQCEEFSDSEEESDYSTYD